MSFSESLNQCMYRSIPAVFLTLSGVAMYLAGAAQSSIHQTSDWPLPQRGNATESVIDYTRNDLLLGSTDSFFWFLLPLFGIVSIGLCIAINYTALAITHAFAFVYSRVRSTTPRSDEGR